MVLWAQALDADANTNTTSIGANRTVTTTAATTRAAGATTPTYKGTSVIKQGSWRRRNNNTANIVAWRTATAAK